MPLTTRDRAEIDQVLISPPEGGLTARSATLPDQLRAFDRQRLVRKLGALKAETMEMIDRSLRIVLGLA